MGSRSTADRLADDRAGRATKLNKVIFFAEFTHMRRHGRPITSCDLTVFTDEELRSIDDVVEQLAGLAAAQVSELSHAEPGWQLTELGETIPYAAAGIGTQQNSTPTTALLSREVTEEYGVRLVP